MDKTLKNYTQTFEYNEHGNMTSMPHLPEMLWDYKDELKEVDINRYRPQKCV